MENTACQHACGVKCISWSAIILGAVVAVGLSFLLNVFCTAIGLSIYRVDAEGVSTLTVGGMLGFAIGIITAMLFSGWVAGFFGRSHCETKCCGAIHGFAAWCSALILVALLAMPFSKFATSYANYLANKTIAHETVIADEKVKATTITVKNQQTVNDLGKGAFVLFLMFFLGAISSTCGGHLAATCCEKRECSHCRKVC